MKNLSIHDVPLIIVIPICCVLYAAIKFLRRQFPVTVNCWFCHTHSRVPYDDWNSFTCPKCRQYNGFAQDGDYNKLIPEQYEELLNHIVTPMRLKPSTPSNGLCKRCNENQQLKVFQLAHFVPLDDDNYDQEIEHFEKQLEKSYVLCKKCTMAVKNKIYDINRTLLAKQIKEIKKSGKTLLNHASNNKLLRNHVKRCVMVTLLTICLALTATYYYNLQYLHILWEYRREIGFTACISIITSLLTYYLKVKFDAQTSSLKPTATKSGKLMKKRKLMEVQSIGSVNISKMASTTLHNSVNSSTYDDSSDSSACSELARLNSSSSEFATLRNVSGRENNSFVNSSFRTESPFSPRRDINDAIEKLRLENTNSRSKSIISPTRFRNPWTGKAWNNEMERSYSQSSGIASRSTSICEDEIADSTCRMPPNIGLFVDSATTQGSFKHFHNARASYRNALYSNFE